MSKLKTAPGFSLNSFVTPAVQSGDWYKKVNYDDAKNLIKEKMLSSAENFVAIGYYLKHISEEEQYKEGGYANIWECAENEFGFSQAKASRCINICKKYSEDGDSPYIHERFKNFNISQLQEMLPIKDEHLIGQITPDMSVKEIRDARNEKDAAEATEDKILPGQMQIATIEGDFREFGAVSNEEPVTEEQEAEPEVQANDASALEEKRKAVQEEPTDDDIRIFYKYCVESYYDRDRDNLKDELLKNMGKTYQGGCDSNYGLSYSCSPRGAVINSSKEITWTQIVNRINELIPVKKKASVSLESEKSVPDITEEQHDMTQLPCDEENIKDAIEFIDAGTDDNISGTNENGREPENVDKDGVFHINLKRITVQLPCAVGETVFFRDDDGVRDGTVDLITFGKDMKPVYRVYDDKAKWTYFETLDFGKLLFYTYRDAENGSCN